MSAKTYGELLRDPRWQKKRLKILQRDGFACQDCGSDANELQVHHRKYRRGAPPWEAEDDDLLTMCSGCHKARTQERRRLLTLIDELDPFYLGGLIGFALALCSEDAPERLEIEEMDYEIISGFAAYHLMGPEEAIDLTNDKGQIHPAAAMVCQKTGLKRRSQIRKLRRRSGAA